MTILKTLKVDRFFVDLYLKAMNIDSQAELIPRATQAKNPPIDLEQLKKLSNNLCDVYWLNFDFDAGIKEFKFIFIPF